MWQIATCNIFLQHDNLGMNTSNQQMASEFKGLSAAEVRERIDRGQVNLEPERSSRSLAAILRENTLTLFNAILGSLLVLILAFGSVRDALFGLVLIGNMLIGIVQEMRAKITLDRLSVLSAVKAHVVREGGQREIGVDEVVIDDVLLLKRGDQVVADGRVLEAQGLEIDESLLTGEAEPVAKRSGDELHSGSFAVAGSGIYTATAVGQEAYARKLTAQAQRFQLMHSELQAGINRILAGVTWVMIPAGLLLFSRAMSQEDFRESVSGSVAAMVGMVPEGLVLLTSVAFAVAIVVLGKRKVLVQELPAVEGLARVDVVCFDKTGTLTEIGLELDRVEPVRGGPPPGKGRAVGEAETDTTALPDEARAALSALAADPASRNPTMDAIASAFGESALTPTARVPFSSERKWSSVSIDGVSWILGAPEILLAAAAGVAGAVATSEPAVAPSIPDEVPEAIEQRVQEAAREGKRVLLLAGCPGSVSEAGLPEGLEPVALVLLEEKIRADAAPTLDYFARQGVRIKVISGDNPVTVAAVARRAGVDVTGEPVDGRSLPEDPAELARVMEENSVFGRVTAHQKRAMVKGLQAQGHVVAMTGDGVNDTLAVKEADIGIAVGKGAAAPTKAVAELVLLDGRFATMPDAVAEGRRVIANIERVAYLFVTKTCYATLLTVVIALLGWPFPFLPRHLTLVGAVTIGIPAFFLALAPSQERYRPGFVRRVLHFTIPAGALLAAGTMVTYALSRADGADLEQSRTVATLVLTIMGLGVLVILARPLTVWRSLLIAAMIAGLVVVIVTPVIHEFLAFQFPPLVDLLESLAVAAVCLALLVIGMKVTGWKPRGR